MSHLGLIVLSAIQGMSAIWDVRYWEVSLYYISAILTLWLEILFYCEKCLRTHFDHVTMIQANKK